jgi:hypothetical protein
LTTKTATAAQVTAAFNVARKAINDTGFGWLVSDTTIQPEAVQAANACVNAAPAQQVTAVFAVCRSAIDATGWGSYISDTQLTPEAQAIVAAVNAAA